MQSARSACLLTLFLVAGICESTHQNVFAQETQSTATSQPIEPFSENNLETGELEELVMVQPGQLPVVLSAPHGGTLQIRGVEPRQGVGMATGPSGFFTGRDAGTSELAVALADAIEKRMGKRPYLVISKVHRKYLDPNRPSGIAYEDSDAAPVYQRYHGMLQRYCNEILEEHPLPWNSERKNRREAQGAFR